jgi:hypothetical protein
MLKELSWKDITVEQYIELVKLNKEGFDNVIDYQIEMINILYDEDLTDKFDDLLYTDFLPYLNSISFVNREPNFKYKTVLNEYEITAFEHLRFGEYIDIEYYMQDEIGNLANILSIIYKKYKLDEFNNKLYEPYSSVDIKLRSNYWLTVPITDVYGVIPKFKEFRENFLMNYKELFVNDNDNDDQDKYDDILSEQDKKEIEAEIEKDKKMAKWSWEFVLYELTNGDITKYSQVLDLPLLFVFNQLTFSKSIMNRK